MTTKISLRAIKRLNPCASDYAIAKKLYPDGVPLTMAAYLRLKKAGADPAWGLKMLLNEEELLSLPKGAWSHPFWCSAKDIRTAITDGHLDWCWNLRLSSAPHALAFLRKRYAKAAAR